MWGSHLQPPSILSVTRNIGVGVGPFQIIAHESVGLHGKVFLALSALVSSFGNGGVRSARFMEYEAVGIFIGLPMPGADVQPCLDVVHEVLAAHRHALAPTDLASGMGILPGCNPLPLTRHEIRHTRIAEQFGVMLSINDTEPRNQEGTYQQCANSRPASAAGRHANKNGCAGPCAPWRPSVGCVSLIGLTPECQQVSRLP